MRKKIAALLAAVMILNISGMNAYAGEMRTEVPVQESTENVVTELEEESEEREGLKYEAVNGQEALPDDPEFMKIYKEASSGAKPETYNSLGSGYTHNSRFANTTVRNGIDVSYYQGTIDWNAVKNSGVEFVFIRVGYRGYSNGALKADPMAEANLRGAINAGLRVGAYIFSQAISPAEAQEEARYAISQVAGYSISMPIVMDFEYVSNGTGRLYNAHLSRDEATATVNAFGSYVKAAGYEPMIYANKTMLENSLNAGDIPYKVWLANYTSQTSYQGNYEFWQYSSNGYVNGISGRVDCNFWYDGDAVKYTQTIADGIYTISSAMDSNYVLDISGASRDNYGNVQLWQRNSRSAQDFKVTYLGDGKYVIVSLASGKVMDAAGSELADGTNIIQYAWNEGNNQKWYIQDAGKGYYYIRSSVNQKCLDVASSTAGNGVNVQLWSANGGNNQKFEFKKTSYDKTLSNGTYTIAAEGNSNLLFHVSDESQDNEANIHLWSNKNTDNQKFIVKYMGGGLYQIGIKHSGKAMDAAGTNVIQYDNNNGSNQRWYIKDAGDGYYNIISGQSGLYVESSSDSIQIGNNIQLGNASGTTRQRFWFETVKGNDNNSNNGNTEQPDGNIDTSKNGWYEENGHKYWYDHGVMARDKEAYDPGSNAWYWFDADGTMAVNKDVYIPTNADRSEGKWVRYNASGGMIKGEDFRYNGWYWFDPATGEMIKGFVNIPEEGNSDGKWVYYDDITGQMHHGESCINNNWYYFDDWTGKMVHGEYNRNGNWYYYDSITGIMQHGWTTLPDGRRMYYHEVTGVLKS